MGDATQLEFIAQYAMIATPILICGAIVFAYCQWKTTKNARMAQIILAITERWDSKEMAESRMKVIAYGSELKDKILEADEKNSPEIVELVKVANFFDSLGVMIAEGWLDCKTGYKIYGGTVANYYKVYQDILENNKYAPLLKGFIDLHNMFAEEKRKELKKEQKRKKVKKRRNI